MDAFDDFDKSVILVLISDNVYDGVQHRQQRSKRITSQIALLESE